MPILPDKVYQVLKWVSMIAIPAIVAFLSVVLGALEVDPKTVNIIVTIIGAVGTLIGALIGVSSKAYNNKQKEETKKDDAE